jgi:hypothetical protein
MNLNKLLFSLLSLTFFACQTMEQPDSLEMVKAEFQRLPQDIRSLISNYLNNAQTIEEVIIGIKNMSDVGWIKSDLETTKLLLDRVSQKFPKFNRECKYTTSVLMAHSLNTEGSHAWFDENFTSLTESQYCMGKTYLELYSDYKKALLYLNKVTNQTTDIYLQANAQVLLAQLYGTGTIGFPAIPSLAKQYAQAAFSQTKNKAAKEKASELLRKNFIKK